LFGLTWRDVDLDAGRIVFRAETRKGGREDIVRAITADLAAELREQRGADEEFVWPWKGDGTAWYPPARRLCALAGVKYHGLHGVRRTSASYVHAAGGDATAHMGHSSPAVTQAHYLVGEIVGEKNGLEFLPRIGERSNTK
jgi:integrase